MRSREQTGDLEWKVPTKLNALVEAALTAGRPFIVNHGEDTGGSPFVSITVKWPQHEVRATWHTRNTGTYRLFSALATLPNQGWHDITATRALALIRGDAS